MTNLAEGRRLAIKLGYLNEDGSLGPRGGQQDLRAIAAVQPEIYVGQGTSPERRAQYQAAGFTLVEFDEPRAAKVRYDPDTGQREYTAAYTPHVYAAATSITSSPPAIMERPRNMWLTGAFEIDRFSLNPGRDSVLQQLNERDLAGPPPEMFGTTALPLITASGADPQILRHVAWQLRTSAAFVSSRGQLLEMIIASQELAVDETLQTEIGRAYLHAYFSSIQSWANTVPEGADGLQGLSIESIKRLYPGDADTGE